MVLAAHCEREGPNGPRFEVSTRDLAGISSTKKIPQFVLAQTCSQRLWVLQDLETYGLARGRVDGVDGVRARGAHWVRAHGAGGAAGGRTADRVG